MPLRLALAVTLGFLTFLSSLMLGLGQGDVSLSVLLGTAAVVSFILTDYRRVIQLGDWTVNVIVVLIFCVNVVDVLQRQGEDLALAIARVLVFVQVVMLFREKDTRFCWQILLISLLQVVVSTVFQQSVLFGVLLLLYVFVGLCAFTLLFLQQEHRYFRQHSFVRTFSESLKAEMAERQYRRKIAGIAFMTVLMGPLSLLLSFGKNKSGQRPPGQNSRTQELLRSLFLIFPTEEDIAQKDRWERVEEIPGNENQPFHAVPLHGNTAHVSHAYKRFPLLKEYPRFAAGTQSPRPWSGNWRELFYHLMKGTIFATVAAIIIFCLVPRIGRIEFNNTAFKQDFERWMHPVAQQVSVGVVGYNDEIQLGSLGTVIPNYQEVIKVRFLHDRNRLVTDTNTLSIPYRAIADTTLYFRGTPLDTYSEGAWTLRTAPESYAAHISGVPEMGAALQPHHFQHIIFEDGCDLVTLAMTIQPMDTQVFFAPHPFFGISKQDEIELHTRNGRVEENSGDGRSRRRKANKTIVSAAFKHGVQLDLTPCQEKIIRDNLLQFPEKGLESLKTLAARWDAESGCSKNDIAGRARFMEQKFLHSREFSYRLGGTIRDYNLDPLEDFVACRPTGHCEYFAGALSLMLRSVGIGSRVIIGFKTAATDYNAACTIRQSDAHAWVEVYIPPETLPKQTAGQYAHWWQNGGWLRLDPTPPPAGSAMITTLATGWTDLNHAVQSFWNDYVLNMTPHVQSYWIYKPLYRLWQFIMHRIFNWEFWKEFCTDMVWFYRSLFSDEPQKERRMWDGFYLIPPFIILGLLGLASWRLSSMLRTLRKRAAEDLRRRITIEFYLRMERMLAKTGLFRPTSLTPLEFARQSAFTSLMTPIVEAFYRVRFGNIVLTEGESKLVWETLDRLERLIAENQNR